ncbi:BTB/POZ protein [Lophiotrema nucula]|uniref:BTB/POZ protein n=1 Tax=Lophiotrema nucula TaxID=690887 RepID=A0A6A5ZUE2_9PLEO|nr:BTB/POZ protein [Lophiotrema nucula]
MSSSSLFNDPTFSDITIHQIYKGETRKYAAHKAILSMRSDYFKRAFTGNFKEATAREIELEGDDPEQFETMLKYIYRTDDKAQVILTAERAHGPKKTAVPSPLTGSDEAAVKTFRDCIRLYRLADYYQVHGLKIIAIDTFRAVMGPDTIYKTINDIQTCEELAISHLLYRSRGRTLC